MSINFGNQAFHLNVLVPNIKGPASAEVQGFAAVDEEFLSQDQVNRATARLEKFIESSPEDEQTVFAALIAQAKGYSDENWPAD